MGGIWSSGKTELIEVKKKSKSKDYQEILEYTLLPCYEIDDIFQQDGASIHRSKDTKEWLNRKGIKTENWPSKSPDMSPIENLWAWIAKRVYGNKPRYETIEELKKAIWKAWDDIPYDLLKKLINSMKDRLLDVVAVGGNSIKY